MLKFLNINNIVLIENTQISFKKKLNVLSGETGAGKSAIVESLLLVMGHRADHSLLRHKSQKGSVEAAFNIDNNSQISSILDNAGIAHETGEFLIIRREINHTGKNRSFVNNQLTQLSLLQDLSRYLVDIVGQHSHQKLESLDYQRNLLDTFANLKDLSTLVESNWQESITLQKKLENLLNSEAEQIRETKICQMELKEIEEAQLNAGEEEELFIEYTQLSHAEELANGCRIIYKALIEEQSAILPTLSQQLTKAKQLVNLDPSFEDISKTMENALLELQEASYTLLSYQNAIDDNPQRQAFINERLTLINQLKHKYGKNIDEIQEYQSKIHLRLNTLENMSFEISELKNQLSLKKKECNHLCTRLTQRRKEAAKTLETLVTQQIRHLNMENALFQVNVSQQERSHFGDDRVEFFLMPNTGEKCIAIRACASGGELSRTLLGLKVVLAGLEKTPTLFFDEIDTNIGGETASIVGQKLKTIGKDHQILCITHLPQVAKEANHHLCIEKKEKHGRTFTSITSLSPKERQIEIARMLGGKTFAGSSTKEFAKRVLA